MRDCVSERGVSRRVKGEVRREEDEGEKGEGEGAEVKGEMVEGGGDRRNEAQARACGDAFTITCFPFTCSPWS